MSFIKTAPDLLRGFMINGGEGPNLWQTDIQNVLSRQDRDGQKAWAYFAKPCRAEYIYGDINSPFQIFNDRFFEAAVVQDWNGAFMVRHGSALHTILPWQQKSIAAKRKSALPESLIKCPEVDVKELSLAQVLEELGSPIEKRNNDLFVRFTWQSHGYKWQTFARSQYINFSRRDSSGETYIQPITGPVLIGSDNGAWSVGYIAAYCDKLGTKTQEAVVRKPVSSLALQKAFSGQISKGILGLLSLLGMGYISKTEDYAEHIFLGGDCQFYRYISE